jgi:hypothetical protein
VKQDSFRKKLRWRKLDDEHICELCSERVGDLEAAHIVDTQFGDRYYKDFSRDRDLPASINDCPNGLLLCSNCHTKYDKPINPKFGEEGRTIQIDGSGKIHLFGSAKVVKYKDLDGTFVPWADKIGKDRYYPSTGLLQYAFELKKVGKNKRMRELSEDEEDSDVEEIANVTGMSHEVDNLKGNEGLMKFKLKKRRVVPSVDRKCDISGCNRVVCKFRKDLELNLCTDHKKITKLQMQE